MIAPSRRLTSPDVARTGASIALDLAPLHTLNRVVFQEVVTLGILVEAGDCGESLIEGRRANVATVGNLASDNGDQAGFAVERKTATLQFSGEPLKLSSVRCFGQRGFVVFAQPRGIGKLRLRRECDGFADSEFEQTIFWL